MNYSRLRRRRRLTASCILACALLAGASSRASGGATANAADHVLLAGPRRAVASAVEVEARFVEDRGDFTVIEVTGPYDRTVDGDFNAAARQAVAQEFLRTHADDYDFLVTYSDFDYGLDGVRAFYLGLKNDVEGIGAPVFDHTAEFGSAGRLQGYVDMGRLSGWETTPTATGFDHSLSVVVHELFHRWGAYAHVNGSDPLALLGQGDSHWSFLLDSDASLLYGNDWRDNGDGSFTSAAAVRFLSPLDLYLAGFYGADEVPPFTLLESAGVDRQRLPEPGATVQGTARQVTIADVIAAEGTRVPAAADAPHRFKAAFIYLVRAGATVDESVDVALDRLREGVSTRFAILTGGRGALEIYPQAPSEEETGSGTPIEGGPVRPDEAVIADALAWLRAQQLPDASWRDRPRTEVRDTAVVSATLLSVDPIFSSATQGPRNWLLARSEATADSLARQIVAVRLLGGNPQELVTRLSGLRNADGGWGIATGYASDPLDTALAILALADVPNTQLASAGQFLLASRGADGGWSNHPSGPSRASVTAHVLRALAKVGQAATVVEGAANWLTTKQNSDGGFGDSPSTAHDTANVLLALIDLSQVAAIDALAAERFLRHRQTIAGSWDGSVYTTALAISALQRSGFPNWQVLGVDATPSQPLAGQLVGVRARIRNSGRGAAPASTLRLIRIPAEGGVELTAGEVAIPPLLLGATVEVTVPWDTQGLEGTQRLVIRADPEQAVVESSESDNEEPIDIVVGESPASPDLVLSPLDLALSPARPDELPADLAVSAVLRNIGRTPVVATKVTLWKGDAETGERVAETTVAVSAQSSVAVGLSYVLTAPGPTRFVLEADADRAVIEADEANNLAEFIVDPVPSVDLEVTPADIVQLAPASVGGDVAFRVRLRNRGTVASGAFAVRYEIHSEGSQVHLRTDVVSLAAGASEERIVTWRVDREGEFAVSVELDRPQVVNEIREDNNRAELAFDATVATLPNLTVRHEEIAFAPGPALEGQPLQVSAIVRNGGGGSAGSFTVAFYAGDPAAGGQSLGPAQVVPELAAGAFTTVSVSVAELMGDADRLIVVVVDPDGLVDELEESDNQTFENLEVLALPDLAISSGSLSVSPYPPVVGQPVTLVAAIDNLGEQAAELAVVRAFDGEEGAGGVAVGGDQTVTIPGGATANVQFAWTFTSAADPRSLIVAVDTAGTIRERSEENNRASLPVSSQAAELFASETYISPDGNGIKDVTSLVFALGSGEAAALTIFDPEGQEVRRLDLDVPLSAGEALWDGRDVGGRVVRDGVYVVRAVDSEQRLLARTAVTVDTDRSSLLLAIGSPNLDVQNRTCAVPGDWFDEPRTSESESWLVYEQPDSPVFLPRDVYRMPFAGGPSNQVLESIDHLHRTVLSPDGTKIAAQGFSGLSLAIANSDGTNAHDTGEFAYWFDFSANGESLIFSDEERIARVPLDGGATEELYRIGPDVHSLFTLENQVFLSPTRNHLVFVSFDLDGLEHLWLLDLATGESVEVASHQWEPCPSPLCNDWQEGYPEPFVTWSPDGQLFANTDFTAGTVQIHDTQGRTVATYHVPLLDAASVEAYSVLGLATGSPVIDYISGPVWSDDGGEIAFHVAYLDGVVAGYGAIYRADLETGELTVVTWLDPILENSSNLSLELEAWKDGEWSPGGVIDAPSGSYNLETIVPPETTAVRVRRAGGRPQPFAVGPRGLRRMPTNWRPTSESGLRVGVSDAIAPSFVLSERAVRRLVANLGTRAHILPLAHHDLGPSLAWVPFDRAVLYSELEEPARLWAVPLARPQSARPMLSTHESRLPDFTPANSPSARTLFLRGSVLDPVERAKCTHDLGGRYDHFHSARSLLNLTADLRVTYAPGGGSVELSGTATDINFAYYQLEWASVESPSLWHAIAPRSNRPVLDGPIGAWFPPEPGTYSIRLTAVDLAGNRRSAQVSVGFAYAASGVTDVSLSSEVISPNGDGVLDQAVLRYRVLAPIRLQIDVYRAGDRLVRSYQREHVDTNSVHEIVWDGRDQAGRIAEEGLYQVRIVDVNFPVTVDVTPPRVTLAPIAISEDCPLRPSQCFVAFRPRVEWLVRDRFDQDPDGNLLIGRGQTPPSWSVLTHWSSSDPTRMVPVSLPAEEFVGGAFRAEGADHGGNRAVAGTFYAPEDLIFTHFGTGLPASRRVPTDAVNENQIRGERLRARLGETIRRPLVSLALQFREIGHGAPTDTPWTSIPALAVYITNASQPAAAPPDHQFEVEVDISSLAGRSGLEIRFLGDDDEENTYSSNVLRVSFPGSEGGVSLRGFVEPASVADQVRQLAAEAGLQLLPYQLIWGSESLSTPLDSVSLMLRSDDDPRYAVPRRVPAAAIGEGALLFDGRDLRPCHRYWPELVVDTHTQNEQTGAIVRVQYRAGLAERGYLEIPCLSLSVELVREVAECGSPGPEQHRFRLRPVSLDGTPLHLLTLSRHRADGSLDLLYSQNGPASGAEYTFDFSTIGEPLGPIRFVATLRNAADQVFTTELPEGERDRSLEILVDRTPPHAALSYPMTGQRLCLGPRVDVLGQVSDETGRVRGNVEMSSNVEEWNSVWISNHVASISRADEGSTTVTLTATDDAGGKACTQTTFYLDGSILLPRVAAPKLLFSPNGDGRQDELPLVTSAGEPTAVTLWVEGGRETDASFIREVLAPTPLEGSRQDTWDGRNHEGIVAPDANYYVFGRFTDSCGNEATTFTNVDIDTVAPTVALDLSHLPFPYPLDLDVRGTATDPHLTKWRLDLGGGSDPETWLPLAAGETERHGDVLNSWNTFGLEGTFTLRLVAEDGAGNIGETRATLVLDQDFTLLSGLVADPRLFSPNEDGRRESTQIGFTTQAAAIVSLMVLDEVGSTVRVLLDGVTVPAGNRSVAWDGRRSNGLLAGDGPYRISLTAAAVADPLHHESTEVVIDLDGTPPLAVITAPLPDGVMQPWDVEGTITDVRLVGWDIALSAAAGVPAWEELVRGTASPPSPILVSFYGHADGEYRLRVHAVDEADNRAEHIIRFRLDSTAPVVELLAPLAGAVVGVGRGRVEGIGRVEDPSLAAWELAVAPISTPEAWSGIASGGGIGVEGALAVSWDTTGFADGEYLLRLSGRDRVDLSGEATRPVTVDNTNPRAAIGEPDGSGWVRGPLSIRGEATDLHFDHYQLAITPAAGPNAGQWSTVGVGVTTVAAGGELLDWTALPPDGRYTLRLQVVDTAGNASVATVTVAVDQHAPAAPAGLTARPETGNGRLSWTASSEADLAGYAVYRDGERLTPSLLAAPSYLDAALADGRHTYWVTAIDEAGNESERSVAVELLIDLTPPVAALYAPAAGTFVSGLIVVSGTASSGDDFAEYRLFVAPGDGSAGGWQLLRRSPLPVRSAALGEWNTTTALEGGVYTLRLEAEDLAGNVAEARLQVTADNLPPGAPTGLVATMTGADSARLDWNANVESELAGYLLYRGGRLVNASGPVVGSLAPYLLQEITYADVAIPDGVQRYVVHAVDRAGNISLPSAPAEITTENRAPHATIVAPAHESRFEAAAYVLATAIDADVRDVQIEWRAAGGTWAPLGPTDATASYEGLFDPASMDPILPHGVYELRAVATDLGGRVDPAPTGITVTYTDLTPPAGISDLTLVVDGGDVHLSWPANDATDLAGYRVHRRRGESGTPEVLNPSPVVAVTYTDTGVADGTVTYWVAAVDAGDNEGAPSPEREGRIYAATISQPYTPTLDTTVGFAGTGAANAVAGGDVATSQGTVALPAAPTDDMGGFAYSGLLLALGDNRFTVRVTDPAGNRSKPATVRVVRGERPPAPTGVEATIADHDVTLTWDPPGPGIVGHLPYDDGQALLDPVVVSGITASASREAAASPAGAAVDNDPTSAWRNPEAGALGDWLELGLGSPRLVTRASVTSLLGPLDLDLQAWDGEAWITVAALRGGWGGAGEVTLDRPYLTARLRWLVVSAVDFVALAEVGVTAQPLVAGSFSTVLADGRHPLTVTAWSDLGFESEPSVVAEAAVGDAIPPPAVSLTATVEGSTVHLGWSASDAADLARYDLYRDGARFAAHSDVGNRTRDDVRPNGTYRYFVTAVDGFENASERSNEVEVTIAVVPLAPPQDLVVTVPAEGSALELVWQPGPGAAPAGYRVFRGTAAGGPYTQLASAPTASYRDGAVTNGTTYYYVVQAVDAAGNASGPSNEASGTPADDEPLGPPTLTLPAEPGRSFVAALPEVDLAGLGAAGAGIDLYRNGAFAGQAVTSTAPAWSEPLDGLFFVDPPRLSPDGRRVAVPFFDRLDVFDVESGAAINVVPWRASARWSRDGKRVLYAYYPYLNAYEVATGNVLPLAAADAIVTGVEIDGPDTLLLLATHDGQSGLWLFDETTWSWVDRVLPLSSLDDLDANSIEVSPDALRVAYRRRIPVSTIEMLTLANHTTQVLGESAAATAPSWSPDSQSLVFGRIAGDGHVDTYRYDVGSPTAVHLFGGPASRLAPQWSPDGSSIASIEPGSGLVLQPPQGSERTVIPLAASDALEWTRGGYLATIANPGWTAGEVRRLTPAGWFTYPDEELIGGENRFTARSVDSAGNTSTPSNEMLVVLPVENLPNLAIEDLRVLPATGVVGQPVAIGVRVRNRGAVAASTSEISLAVVGPQGSATLADRAPLAALSPGQSVGMSWPYQPQLGAGTYTVAATLDPLDLLAEADESDNQGLRELRVTPAAGPVLSLRTDRPGYASAQDVMVEAEVFNSGPRFDGRVEWSVEDAAGFLVTALPERLISGLDFAASQHVSATWGTGETLAGGYRVRAVLRDLAGAIRAEAVTPFQIFGFAQLDLQVTAEKGTYIVGAAVRSTCELRYPAGNQALSGLVVATEVRSAAGFVVGGSSQSLGVMLPPSNAAITASWPSSGRAAGEYRLFCQARRGEETLASAQTFFTLTDAPPAVTGTLTLSSRAPAVGRAVLASWRINHAAGPSLPALPVSIRLVRGSDLETLDTASATVALSSGGNATGTASFATDALGLQSYLVVLEARLPGSSGATTLQVVSFATIDQDDPSVELVAPDDAEVVGGSVQLVARAEDLLSTLREVSFSVDSGGWQPASPGDNSEATFDRTVEGLSEGEHSVTARATDSWDNSAESSQRRFIVDTTPPEILIVGVSEGGSYTGPVTVSYSVTDAHLAAQLATLDGTIFTSGGSVSDAGAHTLHVVASDAAGNLSEATLHFSITLVPPALSLTKVGTLAVDADGDEVASPGDVLSYELALRNTGGAPAHLVVVEDTVPSNSLLVDGSVETTAGSIASSSPLRVEIAALAAGASATIRFRVRVDNPFPASVSQLSNQASAESTEVLEVLSDDPAVDGPANPTVTPITAAPELAADKVASLVDDRDDDGVPSPGDVIEYLITLRNMGNVAASAVRLVDPVPSHSTIVAGSVTTSAGAVQSESPVDVLIGTLSAGGSAEVRFRVTVELPLATGVSQLSNQGTVSSQGLPDRLTDDPNVPGDANPTLTALTAMPQLVVGKVDALVADSNGDGFPSPGEEVDYLITLGNAGNTAATAVMLEDPIPVGSALVPGSVETSQGTIVSTTPPRVDVGTLGMGASATVRFRVRIADPMPWQQTAIYNQASVSLAQTPPVVSDDPAEAGTSDSTRTPVGNVIFVDAYETGRLNLWSTSFPSLPATVNNAESGRRPVQSVSDETGQRGPVLGHGVSSAPRLSVLDASTGEGGVLSFPVVLDRPADVPVSVDYATADGTASAGADYRSTGGRLTLAPGVTRQEVAVRSHDDSLLEPREETLGLRLSRPLGAGIVKETAIGKIFDDETCLGFDLFAPATVEGAGRRKDGWTAKTGAWRFVRGASGISACVRTDLAPAAVLERQVELGVAGRAATGEEPLLKLDLQVLTPDSSSGQGEGARVTLEFLASRSEKLELDNYDSGALQTAGTWKSVEKLLVVPREADAVKVRLIADGASVSGETCFELPSLRSVRAPLVQILPPAIGEGRAGEERMAIFELSSTCPYYRGSAYEYRTIQGSAREGEDYVASSGAVQLAPGATSALVSVPVLGDDIDEPDEMFELRLSAVEEGGAILQAERAFARIENDDFCPRSASWWLHQRPAWPVAHLRIGGRDLTQAEMAALLDDAGAEVMRALVRELATAELNLARGSERSISPLVLEADAFFSQHADDETLGADDRLRAELLVERLRTYSGRCGEEPLSTSDVGSGDAD